MSIRVFTLLYAIVFTLAGILGFLPGLVHPPHPGAPPLVVDEGYGLIVGLLPVNILHNLVHLLFGILGFVAYLGAMRPVAYARFIAVSYGLLTIMGLVPGLNTVFGLIPIYGNDVILHAALAAVAAYFGFVASRGPLTPDPRLKETHI